MLCSPGMVVKSHHSPVGTLPDHLFEEFFRLSSDLMVVLDMVGRVIRANATFLNMLGQPQQKVTGQLLEHYAVMEDRPQLNAALERLNRGCCTERMEIHWRVSETGAIACIHTLQSSCCGKYVLAIGDLHAAHPHPCVNYSRKGEMVVEGDRELLYLLMQNLLDNAWKYTSRRGLAEIVFSSSESNAARVFSVTDNGVGFPMSQRDRLFILFQRLHNHDEYEGIGIGLATAQRVVQLHGGRIWAESSHGEKTRFHFTINN